MSAGAPYGLGYGLAVAAGGVPDAMLQGQEIRRRRELEDMQRQQLAQELDRLRTQREVESYVGDVPETTSYLNPADPTTTPPDTVTTAGGQKMAYGDWKAKLDATDDPGDDMIPTSTTMKPQMATRPLSEDERRAAIFKNQGKYAMQVGRGDLATAAMEKSHQAETQAALMQARKAYNQLTLDNNFEGARQTLNQMGVFGTIAHIGRNEVGDYVFTDDQGNQTPMSDQGMQDALYRMSTDPTIFSRWNAPAITRANAYVTGKQIGADSAEKRTQMKIELTREGYRNTAEIAHQRNLTAIEIAKMRVAAQNFRTSVSMANVNKQSDLQFMYAKAKESLEQQGLPADNMAIMAIVADQKGLVQGTVEYQKTLNQLSGLNAAGKSGGGAHGTPDSSRPQQPYGKKKTIYSLKDVEDATKPGGMYAGRSVSEVVAAIRKRGDEVQ